MWLEPSPSQQPRNHNTGQVKKRESSKAWPKLKKSGFVYSEQRYCAKGEEAGASVSRQVRTHSQNKVSFEAGREARLRRSFQVSWSLGTEGSTVLNTFSI